MTAEIEDIILGTILSITEYQEQIISSINADLFTKKENKIVYRVIRELYKRNDKIDIITATKELTKDESKLINGAWYISSLTSKIGSGQNWENHVRLLKEEYIRRKLIEMFTHEISNLNDRTIDINATISRMPKEIENLSNVQEDEFENIYDIISKRLETYEQACKNKSEIIGINTGHSKINKLTGGWQAGDLIILAARPSMGKTAIALYLSKVAALDAPDEFVPFFSVEMKQERLSDRIISQETEIDSQKLLNGKIEDHQWEILMNKTSKFRKSNLLIDDKCSTIEQIRQRTFKLKSKGKIRMIVIDYLQLLKCSEKGNNRNEEIANITGYCKDLGKKCDCPVILLSQLNRQVESRTGTKRPILSDLRDSGAIEQDADIVMFVHRPEYYGFIQDENGESLVNVIEIIVAKDRNGAIGDTMMHKNDSWSYIGELQYNEYISFSNSMMPFNTFDGIDNNYNVDDLF